MWSRRHECCVKCGTTDRRHEARGLCRLCYDNWLRRVNPTYQEHVRAWQKTNRFRSGDERVKRWRQANPDRWIAIKRRAEAKWPVGRRVWWSGIKAVIKRTPYREVFGAEVLVDIRLRDGEVIEAVPTHTLTRRIRT